MPFTHVLFEVNVSSTNKKPRNNQEKIFKDHV